LQYANFKFFKMDITDRDALTRLFAEHGFTHVVHLAAQAGVRYSLTDPHAYIDTNLVGFGNVLENCRQQAIQHFVFASSSSVYGANTHYPFDENDRTDHPVSLYGATKKANEVMAYSYAHLYQLPCTGLRFFTVYGPYGRPDMALFSFTKKILNGEPIPVYNQGQLARDFTYIDDVVEGMLRVLERPTSYRIYNLGRGQPVKLMDFIATLEKTLGVSAKINFLPMQAGDVLETYAGTHSLEKDFAYTPRVSLQEGVEHFVEWYKTYYGVLESVV